MQKVRVTKKFERCPDFAHTRGDREIDSGRRSRKGLVRKVTWLRGNSWIKL